MLGPKWKNASGKDRSEIVKNLVTAVGIVVGGLWVLFQWNSLFPQTEAEILSATAEIRADVDGRLRVSLGDSGASSIVPDQSDCETNPDAILGIRTLASGHTTLTSASNLPLITQFQGMVIKSANISDKVSQSKGQINDFGARPLTLQEVANLPPEIMIGGLVENRVERDQSIKTSFLFEIDLPFACGETEKLILFEATFNVIPINPVTGIFREGNSVEKVLVSACQIQKYGYGGCNIEQIEAHGQ